MYFHFESRNGTNDEKEEIGPLCEEKEEDGGVRDETN